MYIYIFPFCWQGKIQNHDTGETNTRLSCKVNNAFYMRGTKTGPVSAVISQSIVSYLLYSSSFLLVPLFFFFFFFFSFFQSLPSNDNIFTCSALIYIHPEWATAMVYVKSRRRLQFLSDQPWRCSQAFIVLSCFFLRIRFSCFLLFSSFCLKYNSPPLLLFPFSFFFLSTSSLLAFCCILPKADRAWDYSRTPPVFLRFGISPPVQSICGVQHRKDDRCLTSFEDF